MTYLSITLNGDLWAYRYTPQRIHNTKISQIDAGKIVFDIFVYWRESWWVALLCTTNRRRLRCQNGACKSATLSYLDEDGETNCDTLVSRCFRSKYTLTNLPLDKMAAILADDIFNCIFWMKMIEFRFKFHWNMFPGHQLTKSQHWHRTGDKPLPEPMMTQFIDAYMRNKGEMS